MKTKLLLLAVSVAAISSCSTMYKTGQTPDDVYYSPLRNGAVVPKEDKKEDEVKNDEVYVYNTDDRLIRMGIYDSRWRYLNNDYDYSPYYHTFYNSYSYNNSFYRPNYNKFYYNDYYYNPFYSYTPVYITNVKPIKNTTPRTTNLHGYGKNYNNTNVPLNYVPGVGPSIKPKSSYNVIGKILDNVLSPATPSYNNKNSTSTTNSTNTTDVNTPTRTYTPPATSSSSTSSSGSSSSGGRITRSQ
jgi:hypothetical protein